jgi:hypothetical protein
LEKTKEKIGKLKKKVILKKKIKKRKKKEKENTAVICHVLCWETVIPNPI